MFAVLRSHFHSVHSVKNSLQAPCSCWGWGGVCSTMCLQDAPWVGRVGGASALPTVCTVGGYCGVQMEALTLHEAPLTAPHQGEGWGVASLPHGRVESRLPQGAWDRRGLALHLLRRMSHLPACSLVWGAARSVPHYSLGSLLGCRGQGQVAAPSGWSGVLRGCPWPFG